MAYEVKIAVEAGGTVSLVNAAEFLGLLASRPLSAAQPECFGRPPFAQVKVPTLVIFGSENRATHRGARLSANKVARAEFEILAGGHFLHMDNPCGLGRSIRAFSSRTSQRVGSTTPTLNLRGLL